MKMAKTFAPTVPQSKRVNTMTVKRYVALELLERQIEAIDDLILNQGDHDITFEQREALEGVYQMLADIQSDLVRDGNSTLNLFKRDLSVS